MKITKDKILIELENADDIQTFNDVILFALDLDAKENCMTGCEKRMAQKLAEITDRCKEEQ